MTIDEEPANRDTTSSGGDRVEAAEAWGTLEELLLACAVNRHGADSWDSIAKELHNRFSSSNNNVVLFTPLICEEKYGELKRRFDGGVTDATADGDAFSWIVDALRRSRVEELRREVQRRDASIVSLELKVKRLEEEREKTSKEAKEETDGVADLIIETHGNGERKREKLNRSRSRSRSPSPADVAAATEETEDRSFNESNSTSHKDDDVDDGNREVTAEEEVEEDRGLDREPVKIESDRVRDLYGDGPCSDLVNNGIMMDGETSQASRLGESNELRDSVSESKGGDVKGAAKQSSDVQSSASLSRRKRRGWRGGGGTGSSSGDEIGAEELSPVDRLMGVKSRPLIGFLESLRSHKHGSVFERRLPSQDTEKYRNLIRQHMDLDTVQSKLDKGIYSEAHIMFYRDLLLVFTNAILFYRKSSAEHIAARELRKLVKQEITRKTRTPKPSNPKPKPEPELHLLDPVVKKPRTATTTIVCRRLAPNPPKPPSEEEEEKNGSGPEQKPKVQPKKAINQLTEVHGKNRGKDSVPVTKKSTNVSPSTVGNNSKKAPTTSNSQKKKNKELAKLEDQINDESSNHGKKEKPVKATTPTTKKQGVANFLRRMKQNSPARESADDEEESDKDNGGGKGVGKEKEKEKADKKKTTTATEVARRTSGRMMQGKDQEKEAGKRVAGRPPKRKASKAMVESPAATATAAGKRRRESDGGGSGGRQKKKSKR